MSSADSPPPLAMDPTTIRGIQFWTIFENLDMPIKEATRPVDYSITEREQPRPAKVFRQSPERLTLFIIRRSDDSLPTSSATIFNSPLVDPRLLDYEQGCYRHPQLVPTRLIGKPDIRNITAKFPDVKSLDLCVDDVPSSITPYLIQKLEQWSPQLVTLRLWISFSDREMGFQQDLPVPLHPTGHIFYLFDCINAMPVLKHLFLDIRHYFLFTSMKTIGQFPITNTSLEELYLHNLEIWRHRDVFFRTLRAYAETNTKLQRIGLEAALFHDDSKSWRRLDGLKAYLSKRFFALNLSECKVLKRNKTKLEQICNKFTNLTQLSLTVVPKNIDVWSRCLHQLEALKILWLTVEYDDEDFIPRYTNITPISSVRVLKLDIVPSADSAIAELSQLSIHQAFPNAEMIRILYEGYLNQEQADRITREKWLQETEHYLKPLYRCCKVQRIVFIDNTNMVRDCDTCCEVHY